MSDNKTNVSFEIPFQRGVLKTALTDSFFLSQLVKYFKHDKDLKNSDVFSAKEYQQIFDILSQHFEKFETIASEGALHQAFTKFSASEKENLMQALKVISASHDNDAEYYRTHLKEWVKALKMLAGFRTITEQYQKNKTAVPAVMQHVVDSIMQVNFHKQDVKTLADAKSTIKKHAENMNQAMLRTGIKELDETLNGGLPRGELAIVLGNTNVGKSMFLVSLGAQFLRQGRKVLHIALEGADGEALMRYTSNLSKVEFLKFPRATWTQADDQAIDQACNEFSDNLRIIEKKDFGYTIEELVPMVKELQKTFAFDALLLDYGGLLQTKTQTEGYRFSQAYVHRGLSALARMTNSVVITPAQATRSAQSEANKMRKKEEKFPVLRSEDLSECFEIARVAGVIVSVNATLEEMESKKLRLFLEKQRWGKKGVLFGLHTDYARCNLITGQTYDPSESVDDVDFSDGRLPGSSTGMTSSLGQENSLRKIRQLRGEYMSLKKSLEDVNLAIKSEADDQMAEFHKENKAQIARDIADIITQIRGLIPVVYPNSKALYEQTKESTKDMEKTSGAPAEALAKQKEILSHLSYMYDEKYDAFLEVAAGKANAS